MPIQQNFAFDYLQTTITLQHKLLMDHTQTLTNQEEYSSGSTRNGYTWNSQTVVL